MKLSYTQTVISVWEHFQYDYPKNVEGICIVLLGEWSWGNQISSHDETRIST